MGSTFPHMRRSRLGYRVSEVETFLESARRSYEDEGSADTVTAEAIRRTAFSMERGGYSPPHVDAALERLEDTFALRERDRALRREGSTVWFGSTRSTAQQILDRLSRPDSERFTRVGWAHTGYSPLDVDRFAVRLLSYFQEGTPLAVVEVRTVSFRPKRGGYSETQVDLLLDSVVDVMLAVRR